MSSEKPINIQEKHWGMKHLGAGHWWLRLDDIADVPHWEGTEKDMLYFLIIIYSYDLTYNQFKNAIKGSFSFRDIKDILLADLNTIDLTNELYELLGGIEFWEELIESEILDAVSISVSDKNDELKALTEEERQQIAGKIIWNFINISFDMFSGLYKEKFRELMMNAIKESETFEDFDKKGYEVYGSMRDFFDGFVLNEINKGIKQSVNWIQSKKVSEGV